MTTVIQHSTWAGWPGGVDVTLADDAAIALFSAIAGYRRETGRHDADVEPLYAPVGGIRTLPELQEMQAAYDAKQAGRGGWQAIYVKYNMLASSKARPSLTSQHRYGHAADIAPVAFYNWMLAHGHEYGWRFTLLNAGDPRHAEFTPGTATAALDVTSLDGSTDSSTPGPTSAQTLERIDPNMPTILHSPDGTMAIVVPFGSRVFTSASEFSYNANAGTYPRLECSTIDVLRTLVGEQNERDAALVTRLAATTTGGKLDTAAVAQQLAAALVPSIIAAIPAQTGGAQLIQTQVEAASEEAVRRVLGTLDGSTPTGK